MATHETKTCVVVVDKEKVSRVKEDIRTMLLSGELSEATCDMLMKMYHDFSR